MTTWQRMLLVGLRRALLTFADTIQEVLKLEADDRPVRELPAGAPKRISRQM